MAIELAIDLHGQGYSVVLDADIKGFFDNLPHSVIMAAVAQRVADGNILRLVEKFLTSGVLENGVFKPTTIGTPQGGVISPLLANIVLNSFDWQLQNGGWRFVRYADDFVILCQSEKQAEGALDSWSHIPLSNWVFNSVRRKPRLPLIQRGIPFLVSFSKRSRRMRPKSLKKFKDKIRMLTRRKFNLEASENPTTQPSYSGYCSVLCYSLLYRSRSLPQVGLLDSYAVAVHENQEEKLQATTAKCETKSWLNSASLAWKAFVCLGHDHSVPSKSLESGNFYRGRPVPEKGTPVNKGNQPFRDNGEAVASASALPSVRQSRTYLNLCEYQR